MRPGLLCSIALLTLALACGGDDDDATPGGTTNSAVEDTASGTEDPATTEGGDAPPSDDEAPSVGADGGDDGAAPDAGSGDPAVGSALTPPAAGRYRYELRREGASPTSTALVVETIAEGPGIVQQYQRFEFEDQRRLWVWDGDSAAIDRTETASDSRYGGAAYSCVWSEPPVMLAAPLRVGQRWTTSTSCRFEVDGQQVRHDATEEREVVERGTATVGGTEIEVVRIERSTVLRSTGSRPFTQTVTSIDEFAPDAGLLVRSDTTAVIEDADGSRRGARAELVLQDLTRQG